MRNIRVISSQTNSAKTIQSSATNWGDLKNELANHFSGVSDMKAIVRDTRVTLEAADAVLPTGDFTIILSMKKIASGTENPFNTTRYKDAVLRDMQTKLNNIFEDLLNENCEEKLSEGLSEDDLDALNELEEEGLI
jgi:hypothetical protein